MHDDPALLRRYVEDKSESAFTELVQRHVALVYSVALRRVGGDAQLAEDVTQTVFADLARKAPTLVDRPTLAGWLYAGAHHASAAVVRRERRRKNRETHALDMQTMHASPDADPDWTRLRPFIDDVIVALQGDDREAIALRYFQKRSFAEIGAALRVSEEAARKRVDRALDKLRTLLVERGITSSTAALGLALATIGAATVPAGLGGKIAAHALASAPTGASLVGTIAGPLWPAAAALLVGGAVLVSQARSNAALRAELAQLDTENATLARARTENARLARDVTTLEELALRPMTAPTAPASTNTEMAPAAPRPVIAHINVTPAGTIVWNDEPVKLFDFIGRLKALPGTSDPGGRVNIRGVDTGFSALAYVIDEMRKSKIEHVTVESNAKPDSKFGWSWLP